jgi:hypothetical protein
MLALYAHFSMDTCYQTMVNHFIIRKNNVRCLKLIITAEEVAIVELFICGHTKKIIQKERSIMHGYFTNYTVSLEYLFYLCQKTVDYSNKVVMQ